jgi:hypothetical protein
LENLNYKIFSSKGNGKYWYKKIFLWIGASVVIVGRRELWLQHQLRCKFLRIVPGNCVQGKAQHQQKWEQIFYFAATVIILFLRFLYQCPQMN